MRISIKSGGLFLGADGPVIFQVPGNLYSDAKCDVLIGRVFKREIDGGVSFAECQIKDALPAGLDVKELADRFMIEERSKPGVGATREQRSFFLSRKLDERES